MVCQSGPWGLWGMVGVSTGVRVRVRVSEVRVRVRDRVRRRDRPAALVQGAAMTYWAPMGQGNSVCSKSLRIRETRRGW